MHRYYAGAHDADAALDERIETPLGFAHFPGEIGSTGTRRAPGSSAPATWRTGPSFDRGGHFAALEEPELLVQDVRDFFRPVALTGASRPSLAPRSGGPLSRTHGTHM